MESKTLGKQRGVMTGIPIQARSMRSALEPACPFMFGFQLSSNQASTSSSVQSLTLGFQFHPWEPKYPMKIL